MTGCQFPCWFRGYDTSFGDNLTEAAYSNTFKIFECTLQITISRLGVFILTPAIVTLKQCVLSTLSVSDLGIFIFSCSFSFYEQEFQSQDVTPSK